MCTSTSEQMCVPMLFSEHGGIPAHANMPKKFDDAGPTFSIYTWAATIELSGPGEGHCKVPFPSAWCPSPNPTMDKNANTRSVCICLCHTVTPRATCISSKFRTSSKTSICRMAASSLPQSNRNPKISKSQNILELGLHFLIYSF